MASMNTSRLSPTELRRKLLSLPSEDAGAEPPTALDETPLPSARPGSRRSNESKQDFVMPADDGTELNTITLEQLGAARLGIGKMTPLPLGRLDSASFTREESIPRSEATFVEALSAGPFESSDEVTLLRAKNEELRRILDDLKPVMQEASDLEERCRQKEQVLQAEITNRDQQIQALQEHLRQIEEQIAEAAPPVSKTPDELDEWADELEKESAKLAQLRRQIDQERKQIREDEEALEGQMRQMEVQMARERAMMARQETELKRLSAEITHELEIMQRGDGALREQLAKFQRRHQDVLRGGAPTQAAAPVPMPMPAPPVALPLPEASGNALYRMFRGNK